METLPDIVSQFLPIVIIIGLTFIALYIHMKWLIYLAGLMIMFYGYYLNTTEIFTSNRLAFSIMVAAFGFLIIIYGILAKPKKKGG